MSSPNSRDSDTYQYGPWLFPTVRIAEYLQKLALLPENIPGYKDGGEGRLSAALHAPIDGYGDVDMYPLFFDKVAALASRMCHDHAFEDANKRTAMLVIVFTLTINEYEPYWSERTAVIVASLLGAHYIDQDGFKHALLIACGLDPIEPHP